MNELRDKHHPTTRRGGRPTRDEALRRDQRILDVASRLFMDHGYDGASMDAVADGAGVGKPTLYHRYKDKRELFEAVVTARIEEWLLPLSQVAEEQEAQASSGDLEMVLHDISRAMIRYSTQPGATALQRVIAAQKLQFPELARLAYEQGYLRAVEGVAQILAKFDRQGKARISEPRRAAEFFLNLIIAPTSRATLYGIEIDPEGIDERRAAAVRFFLKGIGASQD